MNPDLLPRPTGSSVATSMVTLTISLPLLLGYASWVYYFLQRLLPKLKAVLEARYGVAIASGFRGSWSVSGNVPWWKATALELCQIPLLVVGVLGPFVVVVMLFFLVNLALKR